ncbi:MAG: tetratricopeptide repeat protein [Bacteroidales bacterium]|nr:tetratricopeptide repeat protein [Bacteroidales bacterium]
MTCLLVVLMGFGASAQNYEAIRNVFSKSYELENEGDYSGAIKKLKSIYDEDSYEINLRLGWLNYNAGMYTESASYYRKATSLMPYSIEAKFGLALPVYAQGNVDQVINIYKEVLKIDPQNYTANYRMGSILYGREDYTRAHTYFEKLVNMYPFDYDALHMFGWTNLKMGKTREARVLFNKALMNKPEDDSSKKGLEMIK